MTRIVFVLVAGLLLASCTSWDTHGVESGMRIARDPLNSCRVIITNFNAGEKTQAIVALIEGCKAP